MGVGWLTDSSDPFLSSRWSTQLGSGYDCPNWLAWVMPTNKVHWSLPPNSLQTARLISESWTTPPKYVWAFGTRTTVSSTLCTSNGPKDGFWVSSMNIWALSLSRTFSVISWMYLVSFYLGEWVLIYHIRSVSLCFCHYSSPIFVFHALLFQTTLSWVLSHSSNVITCLSLISAPVNSPVCRLMVDIPAIYLPYCLDLFSVYIKTSV